MEQGEGATGGVVLPRTAFLHTADQLHCPLFLPWPGDQVRFPRPAESQAGQLPPYLLAGQISRCTE